MAVSRWDAALVLCVLVVLSCGKSLEKQAREQVRSLGGAELPEESVSVTSIRVTGNQAVADLVVKTAVKMRKEDGNWLLDEVRLGDRRWEKIDRILKAVESSRTSETLRQMSQVERGVEQYRETHGELPQVQNFVALIDRLSPAHIVEVIRFDAWQSEFSYRVIGPNRFELRSAGPDRQLDTEDDLVRRKDW